MTARVMYEFFRPRMSSPTVFPVGVLAQDESGVTYAAIPNIELPDDVDASFYALQQRAAFMNHDVLPRLESEDPESGDPSVVGPGDPRLLEALRQRENHHFVYLSLPEERPGTASEALEAEIHRLADKTALRELILRFVDPTTRALLKALD
jgi:hypothetical protein